jgi:hypothetical protein
MIDYLDFTRRVDQGLADEKLRIWRQLTLHNGRPISIYASGDRGVMGGLSLHFFLTYIKSASPHDFERFSLDCLEYALKANPVPLAKQLVSSCLILPCIATHTTYRELVLAAESAEKLAKGDSKSKPDALKNSFLQTAFMPCLVNLTTHKSFHSGARQGFMDNLFKAGEDFLVKTVVAANAPPDVDPRHR